MTRQQARLVQNALENAGSYWPNSTMYDDAMKIIEAELVKPEVECNPTSAVSRGVAEVELQPPTDTQRLDWSRGKTGRCETRSTDNDLCNRWRISRSTPALQSPSASSNTKGKEIEIVYSPIIPGNQMTAGNGIQRVGECPCGWLVRSDENYCSRCGKGLDWK